MIRMRKFPDKNYWAIFNDGVTVRFVYDPAKPILPLDYPEFYDVKVTNTCHGKCSWCYMDSKCDEPHYPDIVKKFVDYFKPMDMNQRPFQIAFGGGNPNDHPEFVKLMEASHEMGIMPNYTTNGMGITPKVVQATYDYCGGVAVSTHRHLEPVWREAVDLLRNSVFYGDSQWNKISFRPKMKPENLKVNLHIIVSDKESIQRMVEIYEEFKDRIDYFVLLPMVAQGRATQSFTEEDFLFDALRRLGDLKKFAFGAKLYPALIRQGEKGTPLDVMLYEPEVMSKFLDLKDMKVYPSSFDLTRRLR